MRIDVRRSFRGVREFWKTDHGPAWRTGGVDRNSSQRSSRCANSSTTSVSETGSRSAGASRSRIVSVQSGTIRFRDAPHGFDELSPALALGREHLPTVGGQTVVPSPALTRFLDPSSENPPAGLEPVEQRVQGGDLKAQRAVRSRLDQFPDFVAMTLAALDERENQQLAGALLELTAEDVSGAGNGNRTRIGGLGSRCTTIVLCPRSCQGRSGADWACG